MFNIGIILLLSASILGGVLVFAFLSGILNFHSKKNASAMERVGQYFGSEMAADIKKDIAHADLDSTTTQKVMLSSVHSLGLAFAKITKLDTFILTDANTRRIQKKLIIAGSPHSWSAEDYVAIQALLAAASIIFGIFGYLTGYVAIPSILIFIVAAFAGPTFYINWRAKYRQTQITKELPRFLNKLVLASMGNTGIRNALGTVCEHTHGILTDEFRQTLTELNISSDMSLSTAFLNLADRIGNDNVTNFVMLLINQSETNAGINDLLKGQEQMLHDLRIEHVDGIIEKSSSYMLFAMALVTFSNLVLAVGPGGVMMIQQLGSLTK